MAFLFAVIALLAVAALAIMAVSSGNTHKPQNQHQPNSQNPAANPNATGDHEQKANDGAEVHEPQNYWERFVRSIERREKFITATSTIFIAAFTIILGVATAFLYIATRNLVSGAEETAERQLRAYLALDEANITRFVAGQSIEFQAAVKNTGQTPAYDIDGTISIMYDAFPLPYAFPGLPALNQKQQAVLGRDQIVRTQISTMGKPTQDTIDKINAGKAAVYVWGRTTYRDAFGVSRYTNFRVYYTKPSSEGPGLIPMGKEGNETN